jgi:hypothetical protein
MLDEGNLEENKGFLCLLIFPCMLDEGNLEDKSVPHYLITIGELYLIENHRHNYGQYLTTRPVHIRTITLPAFIP